MSNLLHVNFLRKGNIKPVCSVGKIHKISSLTVYVI